MDVHYHIPHNINEIKILLLYNKMSCDDVDRLIEQYYGNAEAYWVTIIESTIGNFDILYNLKTDNLNKLLNILYPNPKLMNKLSFFSYNREDIVRRCLELRYSKDRILQLIEQILGETQLTFNKLFYSFARYDLYIPENTKKYMISIKSDNLFYKDKAPLDIRQKYMISYISFSSYPKLLFNKYKTEFLSNNKILDIYTNDPNIYPSDIYIYLLRDDKNDEVIKKFLDDMIVINYVLVKFLINIEELQLLYYALRNKINKKFKIIKEILSNTESIIPDVNLYKFLRDVPEDILNFEDRFDIIKSLSPSLNIHLYKILLLLLTMQNTSSDIINEYLKLGF
ncbi:Hypothetical protein ORPV_565 [Orpheovirus IHUMI-LCC2]|uniref:Uncharacterized protein n=1 Tax=Orpheovirus IHUMI-LCC2 TaxID=2023057 RepID=A0A2I2L4T0_9VIRU|nr:Hypothetical protein ORPV_565 [Orpheovirus IHUMI-LCC2]SNW62469.1 Hypothetical protein ORPV_565 [Orpheovirus IHUMI-LCC2]